MTFTLLHKQIMDSPAERLPVEVLTHIMRYLGVSDRKEASTVNSTWYDAALDPILLKDSVVTFTATSESQQHISQLARRKGVHLVLDDVDNAMTSRKGLLESCKYITDNLISLSLRGIEITPTSFRKLILQCSLLESLDLSGCNSLFMTGQLFNEPNDAKELKKVLQHVKELNLSSIRYLADSSFNGLVEACPQLEKLLLASCQILFHSDDYYRKGFGERANTAVLTFTNIHKFIKKQAAILKSFDISRTAVTDQCLATLAKTENLKLAELYLVACRDLTDKGVAILCKEQSELKVLDLDQCIELGDQSLNSIGTKLTKLQQINLNKCRLLTDKSVSKLKSVETLERLNIATCYQLTSIGLIEGLCNPGLPKLTHLNLSYCTNVKDCFVIDLCKTTPTLNHLDLSSCTITDVSVHRINQYLKMLRSLKLSWCKGVSDFGLLGFQEKKLGEDGNEQEHEHNGECKCTRKTYVSNIFNKPSKPYGEKGKMSPAEIQDKLSEDQIYSVACISGLRVLDLTSCSRVTDYSLTQVMRFREMKSLTLSMCLGITDQSLFSIADNIPSLEDLFMAQCNKITDKGIIYLTERLHRLKSLDVSSCDKLTNHTIDALCVNSYRLRHLDVSFCGFITPQSVEMLENTLKHVISVGKRLIGTAN